MAIFCAKKIEPPVRVCLRLKQTREALGLSIEQVAEKTHIAAKYIIAIDNCDFHKLPQAKAYRIAYIRSYAQALGLDENVIIYQFTHDLGLEDVKNIHPHRHIKFFSFNSTYVIARNLLIAVFIILFASYLIWQVKGIMNPPKLEVYTPLEGYVTNGYQITVQGETEKECHLTINGQEIMANENGQFSTVIDLIKGLNTITIASTKKHGQTTTVTRNIVSRGLVDLQTTSTVGS